MTRLSTSVKPRELVRWRPDRKPVIDRTLRSIMGILSINADGNVSTSEVFKEGIYQSFYYSDFRSDKNGYTIADFDALIRSGQIKIVADTPDLPMESSTGNSAFSTHSNSKPSTVEQDKDEHYVLGICDRVLGRRSLRQHKFDFLRGDPNAAGVTIALPVDAYYPELNLVIEYRERQHTESVRFFDKPDRITVSGVHRGEQRKIYDERRRQVLPRHGIQLVEISYLDFNHDGEKRIARNTRNDEGVIRQLLHNFVGKMR